MTVGPLDAEVRRDASLRLLPLEAGNNEHAVIPRELHVGAVHAGHFNEDNDLRRAFTNVDTWSPRCALTWLDLEFEEHTYSRGFRRPLSSLMNSWTSLKSR